MAWSNPVTARHVITATFGETGPLWASGRHTGMDFSAPAGTDAVAVDDGIVIFAGWGGSAYGNLVKIRHAGVDSWYAHLARIDVRVLQRVVRGQRIGTVGETGNATGPHLHLEARVAGTAVDPRRYLSGQAVTPASVAAGVEGGLAASIPGLSAVLAFLDGIRTVGAFVTDTGNWARLGMFIGGGVLILLGVVVAYREGVFA